MKFLYLCITGLLAAMALTISVTAADADLQPRNPEPNSITFPAFMMTPQAEIQELQARIATTKDAGGIPDPAWTERIRELAQSIGLDPTTERELPAAAPGGITPLEQQIHDLEAELEHAIRPSTTQADPLPVPAYLKEQLNALYAQRPENQPHGNPLDQGNDACPGVPIMALPYYDSGTTVGYQNNISAPDPCGYTNAPEVFYYLVAPRTGTCTISLCGSSYDTFLYVMNGLCYGTQVACNDDFCGLQSQVRFDVTAGQMYAIIVDGYSSASGSYVMNVSDNCPVSCVSGDVIECAETPGEGHQSTDCSGGSCNAYYGGTPSYLTIQCGQTYCARAFSYSSSQGNLRDTDWYQFSLVQPAFVTATVTANDFSPVITGFVAAGNCQFMEQTVNGIPCVPASMSSNGCLQPGTYYVMVATNTLPLTTPTTYRITLNCVPCCQDLIVSAPGSITGNTCGAGNNCAARPSPEVSIAVDIPYADDWSFTMCGGPTWWDSYLTLATQCCGGTTLGTDDDGCLGVGLSALRCVPLTAGRYFLTVEGYGAGDCGAFTINVAPCRGRCCYLLDGQYTVCADLSGSACQNLGGSFFATEACSTSSCYARPGCPGLPQFVQPPIVPGETGSYYTSDSNTPYQVYDNFAGLTAPVSTLRFWGIMWDSNYFDCVEDPLPVTIQFCADNGDLPGTVACTYTTMATGVPLYSWGWWVREYTVTLDPPCTLSAGWISVLGGGDPSCDFLWACSIEPGTSCQYNNGAPWTRPRNNLSFCLSSDCAAPENVVLKAVSATQMQVNLWAPTAGQYDFYTTTSSTAVFPANFTLESTLSLPAGNSPDIIWLTGAAAYKRLVVVQNCGGGQPANRDQNPEASPFRLELSR